MPVERPDGVDGVTVFAQACAMGPWGHGVGRHCVEACTIACRSGRPFPASVKNEEPGQQGGTWVFTNRNVDAAIGNVAEKRIDAVILAPTT
jgi:hypothetical protein